MTSRFSFPWINNIQNAVGSAVNEISRAADDVAESLRGPGNHPPRQQQQQQQQQQQEWHPNPPTFPFFFPSGATASTPPPPPTNPQRIPPASARAIRQLPTILVSPEDLVDENNRECCICLEPNNLGEKVTRLPCAHIYHSECIIDWLRNHHCTCPVCRYELPTDDLMYEAGRAARMQARKPRFARYELERMSIKELINLNRGRAVGIREKKDLIQYLIDKERIDLIPAPEPVEYKMEVLKEMRVSELKRAMAEAGVFFHAKDVVEKSDMISIFVNSGRLNVIPVGDESEDEESEGMDRTDVSSEISGDAIHCSDSSKATLPSKRPLVETVDEASDDERDIHSASQEQQPTPVVMFPSVSSPTESRTDVQMQGGHEETPLMTRCTSASRLPEEAQYVASGHIDQNSPITDQEILSDEIPTFTMEARESIDMQDVASGLVDDMLAGNIHEPTHYASTFPETNNTFESVYDSPVMDRTGQTELLPTSTSENPISNIQISVTSEVSIAPSVTESGFLNTLASCDVQASVEQGEASMHNQVGSGCPLAEYSLAQLFNMGRDVGVDLSSCFERSEIVHLLVAAGVTGRARGELHPSSFANWSISQLRAIASEVNIDISDSNDQAGIVDRILHEVNTERPHLRNYLRVLLPLTTSTLPQLRVIAQDWDVDISDCLAKEEIIQRLITRANQFGFC